MVFPLGSNISDWQIVERRYISEPDSQPILLLGDEMLAIWMCWRKRIILLNMGLATCDSPAAIFPVPSTAKDRDTFVGSANLKPMLIHVLRS